jgi:membrane protein implicated in regulation of membrane protease activity
MDANAKRRVIARTAPIRRAWQIAQGLLILAAALCVSAVAFMKAANVRVGFGLAAVLCVLLAWFSHRVLREIENFKDDVRSGKLG